MPLKLRCYLFRLESRKAEVVTVHKHSGKRGSLESKVSVPPLSPLALSHCTGSIKFTCTTARERLAISLIWKLLNSLLPCYHYYLPLRTTLVPQHEREAPTDSRWTSPKA